MTLLNQNVVIDDSWVPNDDTVCFWKCHQQWQSVLLEELPVPAYMYNYFEIVVAFLNLNQINRYAV